MNRSDLAAFGGNSNWLDWTLSRRPTIGAEDEHRQPAEQASTEALPLMTRSMSLAARGTDRRWGGGRGGGARRAIAGAGGGTLRTTGSAPQRTPPPSGRAFEQGLFLGCSDYVKRRTIGWRHELGLFFFFETSITSSARPEVTTSNAPVERNLFLQ